MSMIRCDECERIFNSDDDPDCIDDFDEVHCESCRQNAMERAYERQQEADLESPPETAREEQLRTWNEHQKAHTR